VAIRALNVTDLVNCGLQSNEAEAFVAAMRGLDSMPPSGIWRWITRNLLTPEHPMELHEYLHRLVFAEWDPVNGPAPAWFPEDTGASNIAWLMQRTGCETYDELHAWSVSETNEFWATMIDRLDVRTRRPCDAAVDLSGGAEHPRWLVGATLNVVDSCFSAPAGSPAIIYQKEGGVIERMSVGELQCLAARVANGLVELGLKAGDRVAIDLPMTAESVAVYLGAVAAGCPVVTVADSFAPAEISVRLGIAQPRCIFTQDHVMRGGKKLSLYEKVRSADAPQAIVLPCGTEIDGPLRDGDLSWAAFLSRNSELQPVSRDPTDFSTILFSSGTTGKPKAIPWDHTTPIKCAVDAHLHHDIHAGDVLCWPTNMGWMMGPWLVFAALMNKASIALFYGMPGSSEFARFVQDSRVTMLGVVPSLVSAWRSSNCLQGVDWSSIRAFSSTGECSNPQDMLFLMSRAGYRPVIEYCGGTEIGGGYITGTVVQHAAPATFSTPALGIGLVILGEDGRRADSGELFLVPPSMGLSQTLLNGSHHEVYYEGTPLGPEGQLLRRHGDRMQRFSNGYFRAHGRADDTMNLGGIKVSSLEIEESVAGLKGVRETAAVAVSPAGGGPSMLVVYAVPSGETELNAAELRPAMQQAIRTRLNPLFKLHDVVVVPALPRTASNKVMRRMLRAEYEQR
jgi:acetyl-CoA synthetase